MEHVPGEEVDTDSDQETRRESTTSSPIKIMHLNMEATQSTIHSLHRLELPSHKPCRLLT